MTAGTVEERIDHLLAEKRRLADRIIGAGEAWITELSNADLRRLLDLSTDTVVGDDTEGSQEAEHTGPRGRQR